MTATLAEWPKERPLVAGDDISCRITLNTARDITGWTWAAIVRSWPGGPVVARFDVAVDTAAKALTLTLAGADSGVLRPGFGFDLRQTSPVERTWVRVDALNVIPSYSDEEP